ncbi:hypothetical protein GB937_002956 [Aspergillus fischeri]|nr:hypothetical protein GB937_002956 [Aspergillus fischeri]
MGQHSAVWQAKSTSLMGSGQFDKAAILSYDFSDVEAKSPNFQISKEEIAGLKAAFDKPGSAFETGFVVGGDKFVAIRADDRSLYGKKGKEGIVVVKAVSCVMVAHHGEAVQTTNAAAVVENLVDYINNPR